MAPVVFYISILYLFQGNIILVICLISSSAEPLWLKHYWTSSYSLIWKLVKHARPMNLFLVNGFILAFFVESTCYSLSFYKLRWFVFKFAIFERRLTTIVKLKYLLKKALFWIHSDIHRKYTWKYKSLVHKYQGIAGTTNITEQYNRTSTNTLLTAPKRQTYRIVLFYLIFTVYSNSNMFYVVTINFD